MKLSKILMFLLEAIITIFIVAGLTALIILLTPILIIGGIGFMTFISFLASAELVHFWFEK